MTKQEVLAIFAAEINNVQQDSDKLFSSQDLGDIAKALGRHYYITGLKFAQSLVEKIDVN